jgi:hypothetical protein
LVISLNGLMIIYSGIVFWLPLGKYHFGCFSVYILVAGAKRKRRREERKKTCSF